MSAFYGLRWKRKRSQVLILSGQNVLLNKLYIMYNYFFLEYVLKYRLWLLRISSLYSWRSESEFWPLFGGYLQFLKQWSDSIYSHIHPLCKLLLIHKSYLCRYWLASITDKTFLYRFFGRFPVVWIICADVSEHSVFSVFKGHVKKKNSSCSHNLLG
jgi:hypothetical protein